MWHVPLPATTADAPAWERLGQFVRQRRAELDLTQDELGVSKAVASALENGRQSSYSARSLARVARSLDWTADSIDRILAGGEPVLVEAPVLHAINDPIIRAKFEELERRIDELEELVIEQRSTTAPAERHRAKRAAARPVG